MDKKEFYFPSSDGKTKIHAIEWLPDNKTHIKGVIQIAHGLKEQISMYEPIAKFFTDRCFVVRGEDHIGHGLSVAEGEPRLYFGPKGSWHFASDDIYKLRTLTRKEYGETPYIMLGFSLGSYLIRDYLIRYNETIDAGIIVGCLYNNAFEQFFGNLFANILAFFKGDKNTSKFLDFIINGAPNKKFKGDDKVVAWLNSSQKAREDLAKDPYASETMTIGLFRELMHAVQFTTDTKNIAKMNKDVPILFISGKDDPVAKNGKTIDILTKKYKEAGVKDVHKRMYPGRHRVLFEEEQENTLIDIYDWACSKLNTEGKKMDELLDEYDEYLEKIEKDVKEGKIIENRRDPNKEHKEFFLRSVRSDKAILVTVEGSLNSITAPKLVDYCDGLSVDLKNLDLVIDLQDIDFIAEPGVKAIEELKEKYKGKITILED